MTTKLEKELLDILEEITFFGGHSEKCDKNWFHNINLPCTCKQGRAFIRANIMLNKYHMGFWQNEVDKVLPKDDIIEGQ